MDMNEGDPSYLLPRECLRQPIPELFAAAAKLDYAVGAHLSGQTDRAAAALREADNEQVRDYIESMWGKRANWPEQKHFLRLRPVSDLPPETPEQRGLKVSSTVKRRLVDRDGFLCRYCSLPVIPSTVRDALRQAYPSSVGWGSTNAAQHSAFQALWLQYDHVVPLARGGVNDETNLVVCCAACNFMKWNYCLAEIGLTDPRSRPVVSTSWDGLTRLIGGPSRCRL